MITVEEVKAQYPDCPGLGLAKCGMQATHRVVMGRSHDHQGGEYCERHANQMAYRMRQEVKTAPRKAS